MSCFARLAQTQAKHESLQLELGVKAGTEWAKQTATAPQSIRLVNVHASVTERAVVMRINRVLKKNDNQLKKYRGGLWWRDLGDYYILDLSHNNILEGHVDIELIARELGVLKDYEKIEKRMNA